MHKSLLWKEYNNFTIFVPMNFKDRIIRATGQKTPFRLIVVDLTATMNEIGKQHNAKGFALKLLAENSIASIFLSASLKYAGTVSSRRGSLAKSRRSPPIRPRWGLSAP